MQQRPQTKRQQTFYHFTFKFIGESHPYPFVKVLKYLAEHVIDKRLYVRHDSDNSTKTPSLHNESPLERVAVHWRGVSEAQVELTRLPQQSDDVRARHNRHCARQARQPRKRRRLDTRRRVQILKQHELLMLSCVTCLLKIVQNMANFLSPYLQRLVHVSCSFSYLIQLSSAATITTATGSSQPLLSPTSSQIELKLGQLRSTLATCIPLEK